MVKSNDRPSADKAGSQIDRFREMARELGADEDEPAFRSKLRVIARQKPKDENTRAPPPKGRK